MIVVRTRWGGQKFFVMGNYFGSLNTDGGTGPSWMNPMGGKINKSIAKQAPKKSPKLEMALHGGRWLAGCVLVMQMENIVKKSCRQQGSVSPWVRCHLWMF